MQRPLSRSFLAVGLALVALLAAASLAFGHDTWLRPDVAAIGPGGTVTFHLTSGEGFAADDFAIDPARLRGAWVRLNDTRAPLAVARGGETPDGAGALWLRATLRHEGIATAWVQLASKQLALDSAKQVEYLDDIHATDAVRARWRGMASPRRWRESYTKHAKAFVRVGASRGDTSWSIPVGLTLEIIPERDPTALHAGDRLPVRVLKHGKPLAGLPLGALHDGEPSGEWRVTDASGRATFTISRTGSWLLHGTELRPSRVVGLEWESDFTTLTLAIAAR